MSCFRRARWLSFACLAAGMLTACVTIGPQTITRDRFDYGSAIARSWQDQMLLNIVKLRYGDTPVFLEVASVISQYSLEGQVDLSAGFNSSIIGSDTQAIGAAGRYAERPTITYAPLFGQRFVQSLMQPIPPATVFSLSQGGWPIDFVFLILVRTINGLHNQSGAQLYRRDADPDFVVLLQALRRLQESEAIGIQLDATGPRNAALLFFRLPARVTPEVEADTRLVRSLLGLADADGSYELSFSAVQASDRNVAMTTRSMLELLVELSMTVDVPNEDIESGRTVAAPPRPVIRGSEVPRLLRIHSGSEAPAGAFVAVPYGQHWFWIEDTDHDSKRLFSVLLMINALAETSGAASTPAVTISAGN
jgi:hypothetical protein